MQEAVDVQAHQEENKGAKMDAEAHKKKVEHTKEEKYEAGDEMQEDQVVGKQKDEEKWVARKAKDY